MNIEFCINIVTIIKHNDAVMVHLANSKLSLMWRRRLNFHHPLKDFLYFHFIFHCGCEDTKKKWKNKDLIII